MRWFHGTIQDVPAMVDRIVGTDCRYRAVVRGREVPTLVITSFQAACRPKISVEPCEGRTVSVGWIKGEGLAALFLEQVKKALRMAVDRVSAVSKRGLADWLSVKIRVFLFFSRQEEQWNAVVCRHTF